MKKTLIAAATALTVLGSGAVAPSVQAYGPEELAGGLTGFVQRIVAHFGLDETEAQILAGQYRAERYEARHAEREQARTEHFDQLVADGVLTAEQRALFEAKHEERRADRDEHHAEMQEWAAANGIDLEAIRPDFSQHGQRRGLHR